MQFGKQILVYIDLVVFTVFGFNFIELFSYYMNETIILFSFDFWEKKLLAVLGVVLLLMRVVHFFNMSRLEKQLKEEELKKIRNGNKRILTDISDIKDN